MGTKEGKGKMNGTNGAAGSGVDRSKLSDEQLEIVDPKSPRVHTLVVAGAGSGKTHTMTQRIIKLITEDKVSPEQILGLTFTRMAAGELLSRVGHEVDEALRKSGVAKTAATSLRPEVYTYDAFFQQIVRQYGLLIGVDQNVVPLSEQGRYQLASQVVGEHLDELYAAGAMDDDASDGSDKDSSGKKGEGDDDSDGDGQTGGKLGTVVEDLLKLNSNVLSYMISKERLTFEEAVESIREYDKALKERMQKVFDDADIPEYIDNNLTKAFVTGELSKVLDHEPAKDEINNEYARAKSLEKPGKALTKIIEATDRREMLLGLAQAYQDAKRANGLADYADFTMFALQLLERFPSIGEDYRRRFSHVFLDEYQDTSTTQALLLAKLFHVGEDANAQSPDGSAEPGKGDSSVTAVGDPYQSIYAWRGASPGAFRWFQGAFGLDKDPLPMTTTRRNPAIVLNVANAVTAVLRQEPSVPSNVGKKNEEVEVSELKSLTKKEAGDTPWLDPERGAVGAVAVRNITQEAEAVACFVRHEVDHRHDPDRKPGEPTVAVLFRRKQNMRVFAKAIDKALEGTGLTCEVVGNATLLERPEVKDVLAALSCVTDHSDTTSLMRLLGTPRFGVTARGLERLARLANRINKERGMVMLMHAGLLAKDADDETCERTLGEYRNQLPPAMMLIDLVMADDFAKQAERSGIDGHDVDRIAAAGRMLRTVERAGAASIKDMLHTAAEALGLDIDLIVAQAFHGEGTADASVRASLESLDALADSYVGELPASMEPSVFGFLSWLRSGSTGVEDTSTPKDTHADVVLMTIHQAKGLQWCAVAVPELANSVLPNSKRNGITVKGGTLKKENWNREGLKGFNKAITVNSFTATANTWLTQASDVPVPVRADWDILPRFPHDLGDASEAIDALGHIDGLDRFEREYYGLDSSSQSDDEGDEADPDMPVDDGSADDGPADDEEEEVYLSQKEEWGRRAHADARRLAYVAMTRASNDMLLTYSSNDDSKWNTDFQKEEPDFSEASPFWSQAAAALSKVGRNSLKRRIPLLFVGEQHPENEPNDDSDPDAKPEPEPVFAVFAGRDAQALADAVTGRPLDAPVPDDGTAADWPRNLNDGIGEVLRESARRVSEAKASLGTKDKESEGTQEAASVDGHPSTAGDSAQDIHDAGHAVPCTLSEWADRLLATSEDSLDGGTTLESRAQAVLGSRPQGVTRLRDSVGTGEGTERRREFYKNVIRPVPQAPSHVASLGTRFHEWVEAYLNAVIAPDGGADGFGGVQTDSRESMEADLTKREEMLKAKASEPAAEDANATDPDADERHLALWERRLTESRWARRTPLAAEQPIVLKVNGQPIIAVIDAVFAGALDDRPGEETPDHVTIVDWKTGRKPTARKDIDTKLSQLDMYRLAWSRHTGLPLDHIDATLYYTGVADPDRREIHARGLDEAAILHEFSLDNPEGRDPRDVEEDADRDQ